MLTYEMAVKDVFLRGTVPTGYFGDRMSAGFHFDQASGKTFVVVECGFYNSGLPQVNSQEEAGWLLKNHPTAKNIQITKAS